MRISKSEAKEYRELCDRYAREHQQTEYEIKDVIQWGLAQGRLIPPKDIVVEHFQERIRAALSSDRITTPGGKHVRVRYALTTQSNGETNKPTQKHLWAHLEDARDEFLIESLNQRLKIAKADVAQVRADLDYINQRRLNKGLRSIQLDFEDVIREAEQASQETA